MELKLPTPEQLRLVYDRDLREAFPQAELKPLANMEKMWSEGWYKPYCLFEGEEILGEAFLWLGHPGWALLDYLCVSPAARNGGLGAAMLKELSRVEADATACARQAMRRRCSACTTRRCIWPGARWTRPPSWRSTALSMRTPSPPTSSPATSASPTTPIRAPEKRWSGSSKLPPAKRETAAVRPSIPHHHQKARDLL